MQIDKSTMPSLWKSVHDADHLYDLYSHINGFVYSGIYYLYIINEEIEVQ